MRASALCSAGVAHGIWEQAALPAVHVLASSSGTTRCAELTAWIMAHPTTRFDAATYRYT
jgi:hypothetical protein